MSADPDCPVILYDPTCTLCPPAAACALYDGSGSVWPTQRFPADQFLLKFSASDLRDARAAWNLFERVESQDAATRVRLSTTGWPTPTNSTEGSSIWYQFTSNDERLQYIRGKALHAQLCPLYNWKSQRDLGITPPPVNVYPALCGTSS
jgi:hypothetical protein